VIGMLIALVGSNMYFFRSTPDYPKGQLNPEAYPAMGFTFAIIILIVGLGGFLSTKKIISKLPQRTEIMREQGLTLKSILRDLATAFKNKDFLVLVLMIFRYYGFIASVR